MPTTKLKSVRPELPESGDQRTLHLETLYRLTDRLYRASGTEPMLSAAMEAIIEGLGCEKCSILLFDAEGVMRFVAWRGLSETCRRKLEGHTPWQPDSLDPPPIFIPDIAERKRAEVQRELLLAELNHRVKNTLAVVQGLAHLTFRQTDGPARKAFEGRLEALAGAHDLLTRSHWESTSLEQLAADTLQTGGADAQRLTAEGPHIALTPHSALTIALALHELFTNALKYGALSSDQGSVSFRWKPSGDQGKLEMEWRESGGPPVTPPVACDLGGRVELSFEPEGVSCVIEMPVSAQGGHAWHG